MEVSAKTGITIIILISGASSGIGALSARALADTGHTVYAGTRGTTGKNAPAVEDTRQYASEHSVALKTVEMDVAIKRRSTRQSSTSRQKRVKSMS